MQPTLGTMHKTNIGVSVAFLCLYIIFFAAILALISPPLVLIFFPACQCLARPSASPLLSWVPIIIPTSYHHVNFPSMHVMLKLPGRSMKIREPP